MSTKAFTSLKLLLDRLVTFQVGKFSSVFHNFIIIYKILLIELIVDYRFSRPNYAEMPQFVTSPSLRLFSPEVLLYTPS